jgi:hypothetical protein
LVSFRDRVGAGHVDGERDAEAMGAARAMVGGGVVRTADVPATGAELIEGRASVVRRLAKADGGHPVSCLSWLKISMRRTVQAGQVEQPGNP